MHKLLRCLASLVLVFSLSCVSLTAFAIESPAPYGIVVNEGSVMNWPDITIGSKRVGDTVSIPAGNFTFNGFGKGEDHGYILGGGKTALYGTGVDPSSGVSMDAVEITLSEGIWEYHKSLSGTIRFLFWVGTDNAQNSNSVYFVPSGVKLEVISYGSTVIASQDLTQIGQSWKADLQWDEQGVRQIKMTIYFPEYTKDSKTSSWYRYCGVSMSTSIRWDGTTSESDSVNDMVDGINQNNELQAESNSLLSRIIESITSLPSKIAESIKGLFIPDEAQIDTIRGKWQVFLTTKMGFIYNMFQWVDTFFDGIIDNLTGEDTGAFEIPAFPAFEAGGETVQLWSEPLTVDFSDNAFVQTLQPIACPFILGVTAYHLWFAMSDLMECFFAGKSYRDYHEGRKDE